MTVTKRQLALQLALTLNRAVNNWRRGSGLGVTRIRIYHGSQIMEFKNSKDARERIRQIVRSVA